ncbi:MAG: serine/threonine-protein phosphatase, partial [Actinomycetota bacterium]|nr:serine/threonine-protein phosphatase [Actinomycetota bacterium]
MTGGPGPGAGDLLQAAARAIHGERDPDRISAWLADALAAATGAKVVGLAISTPGRPPRWIASAGSGRELQAIGDPDAVPDLAAAINGARAGSVADDHLCRVLGVGSLWSFGIARADGGRHGVALLGWPGNQEPPPGGLRTAETLIAHYGVALDNSEAMADLEAAQRGVVNRLQEAVRPPTPTVPDTELGVYYRAADEQRSTGGDLYDWIVLPDGNLHLAVVDVMGKGVAATKDAVAVTHALRLLVLDGCPIDKVIARADTLVTAQNPGLVATLVLGRYHPSTGELLLV